MSADAQGALNDTPFTGICPSLRAGRPSSSTYIDPDHSGQLRMGVNRNFLLLFTFTYVDQLNRKFFSKLYKKLGGRLSDCLQKAAKTVFITLHVGGNVILEMFRMF